MPGSALPGLEGFFWSILGRNKSYCRVSLAVSGSFLAVTNPTPGSFFFFLFRGYGLGFRFKGLGV